MDDLTDMQREFLDNTSPRKIIFGSRQVGKSTALARDAIDHAEGGENVGLVSSQYRMTRLLLDRIQDLVSQPEFSGHVVEQNMGEVVFVGGGRIVADHISNAVMDPTAGPNGEPASIRGYDHLVVDEADHIEPKLFDDILRYHNKHSRPTLSVAGTSKTDSPNIKPLVNNDDWVSFHSTYHDVDHLHTDDIYALRETMSAEAELLEIDGLFVTDPSDQADYNGQES